MNGITEAEERAKKDAEYLAAKAREEAEQAEEDEDDEDEGGHPEDVEGDVENYNPDEEKAAKDEKVEL